MDLVYVSSNPGKWESVQRKFNKLGMDITYQYADLDEPEVDDITYISREKARQAYELVHKPVFVADSGFYIHNYPGKPNYPGIYAKRSGVSNNIEELLITLEGVTDRGCHFLDCLTFYDGNEYYTFYGKSEGTLATEKRGTNTETAKSRLWYIFIPIGETRTLAEMTLEEIEATSTNNTSANLAFATWYHNTYLNKPKQYTIGTKEKK